MSASSLKEGVIRGSIAGAVATVGMTAAMLWMYRRLPRRERYGLPPEQIVDDLLDRADAADALSQHQFETLSMAAHHGYGATMGAVYGALSPHIRSGNPIATGTCFGLAVWALSYLGWLPAWKMRASATHEPLERNMLTITAHIVWGALTGLLAAQREPTQVTRDDDKLSLPDFISSGGSSRCPFHAIQPSGLLNRLGNR
jgi:uncharacterized membrane protein YagU involved in acid resistance